MTHHNTSAPPVTAPGSLGAAPGLRVGVGDPLETGGALVSPCVCRVTGPGSHRVTVTLTTNTLCPHVTGLLSGNSPPSLLSDLISY